MKRLVTFTAGLLTVVAVLAAAAPAADGPVAGTTRTTTCRFTPHDSAAGSGVTQCSQTTVIVRPGACVDSGYRLWEEDDIASARTYRGNAVLSGLDGATVEGTYSDVVRPHARLLYDSGPHAFSVSFPVADQSCT